VDKSCRTDRKNKIDPDVALRYILAQLLNQANNFQQLSIQVIGKVNSLVQVKELGHKSVLKIILDHIQQSDYAARLMEIAMHSLMQAMQDFQVFPNSVLKPLSQMRSANKKHGNVGDIYSRRTT
jgi:hypothetical protein